MTKTIRIVIAITVVGFALTALVVSLAPKPLRGQGDGFGGRVHEDEGVSKQTPPCSVASMVGDWAFLTRTKTSGGVDGAGTGTYHLGKDGHSSAHGWFNYGGVFLERSMTGTTTVDSDCTGTQAWEGSTITAKIVILRNGREIWAVYDGPDVITVILKRLDEPL